MPKRKKCFFNVPRLYQRTALDLLMFGYIRGIKKAMPSTSIKECIEYFMEDNALEEEVYPLETAEKTYARMQKEYYESLKSIYH